MNTRGHRRRSKGGIVAWVRQTPPESSPRGLGRHPSATTAQACPTAWTAGVSTFAAVRW